MTPEPKARVGIDVLRQHAGWQVCGMAARQPALRSARISKTSGMKTMYDQIKKQIAADYFQQRFSNDGQRFVAWYLRNVLFRDMNETRDDITDCRRQTDRRDHH